MKAINKCHIRVLTRRRHFLSRSVRRGFEHLGYSPVGTPLEWEGLAVEEVIIPRHCYVRDNEDNRYTHPFDGGGREAGAP